MDLRGDALMEAILVTDRDGATGLSSDLKARLSALLHERGHRVEVVDLGRGDAAPCRGCLLCLTRHPGRCVAVDAVARIAARLHLAREGAITVFITPVLFGHFSSVVKNAVDRGAGSRRLQVFIGYGGDIDEEEERTFIDLVAKHRGAADIVHPGMDREVLVFVTRSVEDNAAICESLGRRL